MSLSEWRDVSAALDDAASQLELGELLHDADFSLQRTMTAVVVGSDRMDTGARDEAEDPAALANTTASVEDLSLEQKLAVMDRILTLQASYHEGTGLGRSVYTCLYFFNLSRLRNEDPLLFEFCSLVAVACANVRELLLDARVCEDEDFNILTNGLPNVNTSQPIDNATTKAEHELMNGQKDLSDQSVRALLCRLRFERYWLLGIRHVMMKTKQSLVQASRHFSNAETELKIIVATSHLKSETCHGFNDRLSTAAQHMRFSRILSESETWSHYGRLLEELKISTSVVHISNYKELTSFLLRYSNRNPGPIGRSALYLQLDDRKQSSDHEISRWVPSKRMLAEIFGITQPKLKELGAEVNYFLEQAIIGVQNLACCMCLNPFRQRRRLKQSLEDWHHLYDHAQTVDTSTDFHEFMKQNGIQWPPGNSQQNHVSSSNPGPFTIWVEKESCQIMIRHLLLGFDQELYQPNEYLSIYWYCDYLLTRIVICARELFHLWPTGTPTNKKQIKAHQQAEIIRTHKYSAEIELLELERSLCQGLTRLLLGMKLANIVSIPPLPFNQEHHRFEQRFMNFFIVEHPEPLDFFTFQTSTSTGQTEPSKLLLMAARFFGVAKEHCALIMKNSSASVIPEETSTRVQQLEKIAKANGIAASVLNQLIGSGFDFRVRFNFEADAKYPCIAISR